MSALSLRIFASICMLLDHLGFLFPQYPLLRYIGRLAFPIYIFLLVNGYRHSSNRLRYALRLGLFALVSQVPFTLFCGYGSYFTRGNVFFTLLIALLVLWLTDTLARQKRLRFLAPLPALLAYALYHLGWLSSDYGAKGFLLALSFFYLGDRKLLCLGACIFSVFHGQFLRLAVQTKKLPSRPERGFLSPHALGAGAKFLPACADPYFPLQRQERKIPQLRPWKVRLAVGILPVLSPASADFISCGLTKSVFSDRMLPSRQFETILSKNKTMER